MFYGLVTELVSHHDILISLCSTSHLSHSATHCPSWRNSWAFRVLRQRMQCSASAHCKQPGGQASHTALGRLAKKPAGHLDTHVCCAVRKRPGRETVNIIASNGLDVQHKQCIDAHTWVTDRSCTLYTGFSLFRSRTRMTGGSPCIRRHLEVK